MFTLKLIYFGTKIVAEHMHILPLRALVIIVMTLLHYYYIKKTKHRKLLVVIKVSL